MSERRLADEAVRVYRRYATEIVEGLGFCPYAERARLDGRTREVPIVAAVPTDAEVLAHVERLADDATVEIGLLLFPRLTVSRPKLGRWVEHLRKAHAAARGGQPVLAIEGFHPDADADTSCPERLTPFVRRTPDPTLQLTRLDALERIRRGTPQGTAFFDPTSMDLEALLTEDPKRPLHERIAELNHETVVALGVEAVRRKMDAILRDRDASYAALDPTLPRRLAPSDPADAPAP